MIKKISIEGFQSLVDVELDIHPGVNCIIGTSDKGKSAIFRSFNWVFDNTPLGTHFINWDSSTCSVKVDIDDHEITRMRGKTKNLYILNDEELLAGRGVPEDLQDIFAIDSAINIQHQIGAPFLLSSSPGDVATFFNDIAGLSEIDMATKNIKQRQSRCKRDQSVLETLIDEGEKKVATYDYLPDAEQHLELLETMQEDLEQQQLQKIKLSALLFAHKKEVKKAKPAIKLAGALPLIKKQIEKYHKTVEEYKKSAKVRSMVSDWNIATENFTDNNVKSKLLPKIVVLTDTLLERNNAKKQLSTLNRYIVIHNGTTNVISRNDQLSAGLIDKINSLMPERCPLCDSVVSI